MFAAEGASLSCAAQHRRYSRRLHRHLAPRLVLRVADLLHPFDVLAIERLLDGDVCHGGARRCAPGSNVTALPAARAGATAEYSGSMRTMPVNQSAGPFADGCEPLRLISIDCRSRWMTAFTRAR